MRRKRGENFDKVYLYSAERCTRWAFIIHFISSKRYLGQLSVRTHLDNLLRLLVTEIKKKPQRVEAILQAYLPMYATDA